jgi:Protein of unknown function (DUF2934)
MASRRDAPRTSRSAATSAGESPPTVYPPDAGAKRRSTKAERAPPSREAPTPEAMSQAAGSVASQVPQSRGAHMEISRETRYRMICEAAYLRAERRGFMPGAEVEDWLAAEEEVDRLLSSEHASTPQ